MKRKRKNILTLSLVTLVLGIFLASDFYQKWKNREKKNIEDINTPAFSIPPESINSFKIIDTKFIRIDNRWFIESAERVPADSIEVTYFLTFLHSIKKIRVLDPDPAVDYGFQKATITINDDIYKLGNTTFNPDNMYIQHPSGKIFVISQDIRKHLKTKIVHWFDKKIGIDLENIVRISLPTGNKKNPFFNLEKRSNQWFHVDIGKTQTKASNESVEKLILALKNLRAKMILYKNLFNNFSNLITLTLKDKNGTINKLNFFKGRPEGFVENRCFYFKNTPALIYQVTCSAHSFLTRSRSRYIDETDFSIPAESISSIELRTRQYLIPLAKINANHWDFAGKNVTRHVRKLFGFFENLSVKSICESKCHTRKNLNSLIIVSFFDNSGEKTKKFLFNTWGSRSWFTEKHDKKTYFIPPEDYIFIGGLVDSFANY